MPSRSDTVLVTEMAYNASGWQETVTNPKGLIGKTCYDHAGRVTKTVENYVDGTVSDSDDKTVEYTYNGLGQVKTLSAKLTGGGQQVTENLFGVSTSGGLVSNDIVGSVRHPDTTTGSASSSEQETITYNQLGQVLTVTDRNGTVHTYSYDVLGRVIADTVTTLGSGVDGSVRRVEMAYDGLGNAYLITTYNATSGGSVVNQVQRSFDGLGQLVREWQAHSGVVNTSTTPSVQYAYSFAPSGSTNHSRLTSITYPSGRVLTYNYTSGLDASISRLSSISDGATTLEGYSYLGLGTVVERSHPENGVDLSYIKLTGESDGDAGDQYAGLDRFGRIVDQRWIDSNDISVDRWGYGHDRNSNRLYKENLVNSDHSELYAYDNLNQLTSFERGELNGTKTALTGAATRSQTWDFDALGNFDNQSTDGTGQARGHNKQNEITSIASATTPVYDANGNLITDEQNRDFTYDAWNRLVTVRDSSNVLLAQYEWDGLGRRVTETRTGSTSLDLFYTANWQVAEEWLAGGSRIAASYAWSPVYVDALIARDYDTDADFALDQRLYAAHDANFNVTALIDTTGVVVERVQYDPYGLVTAFLDADFRNASSTNAFNWNYLHQGGRWDSDAGVYSFRFREFSPTLGRWLQMDPIGFAGGATVLYSFSNNAPTVQSDWLGLRPISGYRPPRMFNLLSKEAQEAWLYLEKNGWRFQDRKRDSEPKLKHDDDKVVATEVDDDEMLSLLFNGRDIMWRHDRWAIDFSSKGIWIDYNRDRSAAELLQEIVIELAASVRRSENPLIGTACDAGFTGGGSVKVTGGSVHDVLKERFPIRVDGIKLPVNPKEARFLLQLLSLEASNATRAIKKMLETPVKKGISGRKELANAIRQYADHISGSKENADLAREIREALERFER